MFGIIEILSLKDLVLRIYTRKVHKIVNQTYDG